MNANVYNENKLREIYDICTKLQNTASLNEKKDILSANADNDSFKTMLKFLLDGNTTTGINGKKIHKKVTAVCTDTNNCVYNLENLLEYISTHNTGRDEDIAYCRFFISHMTDDENLQSFVETIITKSLKLGVDTKTANTVYGNSFIPVFNVMLGTSIEKCKIPKNTWFAISQKLNGSRCFYYKGTLYTRQSKKYTGCEHIIKDLEVLLMDMKDDLVVDGELILKDNTLSDSEAFQKGVGIANSDQEKKEELKLVIFDIVPVPEFEEGISNASYQTRNSVLQNMKMMIANMGLENIDIVSTFYTGTDQNEIWKWLAYAEENDMEGIMVNLDTPYECKRTKNLIKVKKFYTADLKVTDVVEGEGRLKGTLGALVVDYNGNTVNVGTGFSDDQRKTFWETREDLIGRVVEVKYKEVTKNKDTNMESLQFPIFLTLREHGKEVNIE